MVEIMAMNTLNISDAAKIKSSYLDRVNAQYGSETLKLYLTSRGYFILHEFFIKNERIAIDIHGEISEWNIAELHWTIIEDLFICLLWRIVESTPVRASESSLNK